jgi:hypothetical protein
LKHFGEAIDRAKINMDGLNKTIENLKNPDSAFAAMEDTSIYKKAANIMQAMGVAIPQSLKDIITAAAKQADQADATNHSFDRLAHTVEKLNKEMTNVPQGFKDTLYRFNATVAGMGAGERELRDSPTAQVGDTNIYVTTSDPVKAAEEVVRVLSRRSLRISGSSVSNGQPFSTAKNTRVRQFGS